MHSRSSPCELAPMHAIAASRACECVTSISKQRLQHPKSTSRAVDYCRGLDHTQLPSLPGPAALRTLETVAPTERCHQAMAEAGAVSAMPMMHAATARRRA